MMNINIVCVGRLKEDYLRMACAEYEKRLGAFCRLKITVELTPARLPEEPNPAQISAALAEAAREPRLHQARRGWYSPSASRALPFLRRVWQRR